MKKTLVILATAAILTVMMVSSCMMPGVNMQVGNQPVGQTDKTSDVLYADPDEDESSEYRLSIKGSRTTRLLYEAWEKAEKMASESNSLKIDTSKKEFSPLKYFGLPLQDDIVEIKFKDEGRKGVFAAFIYNLANDYPQYFANNIIEANMDVMTTNRIVSPLSVMFSANVDYSAKGFGSYFEFFCGFYAAREMAAHDFKSFEEFASDPQAYIVQAMKKFGYEDMIEHVYEKSKSGEIKSDGILALITDTGITLSNPVSERVDIITINQILKESGNPFYAYV